MIHQPGDYVFSPFIDIDIIKIVHAQHIHQEVSPNLNETGSTIHQCLNLSPNKNSFGRAIQPLSACE